MADDLTNLRLSGSATAVADDLLQTGFFDDRVSIVKLGFSYAINRYYGKFSPADYEKTLDSDGLNYNVGSLDGDKSMAILVKTLYPECTTPYHYVRAIICYGLGKLADLNSRGELFPIYEIL